MKMLDIYGNVMMEIVSLERKGDSLLMKGKMMGTMPATIYIKPKEVWQGIRLLRWPIITYLPLLLFRAWRSRKDKDLLPSHQRSLNDLPPQDLPHLGLKLCGNLRAPQKFDWADIKQNLKALQEITIEDHGKSIAIRSECFSLCLASLDYNIFLNLIVS